MDDMERMLHRLVRIKWSPHSTKASPQLVKDIVNRSDEMLTRCLIDIADLHATAGLSTLDTFATILSALLSRAASGAVIYNMEQEVLEGLHAALDNARKQAHNEIPEFRRAFEAARRRAGAT